jgi:hypothetical protein
MASILLTSFFLGTRASDFSKETVVVIPATSVVTAAEVVADSLVESSLRSYLFPRDLKQMQNDLKTTGFDGISGILIEIDDASKIKMIPDLVKFLSQTDLLDHLDFRNADGSPSFTVRLVYSDEESLTALWNNDILARFFNFSVILDKKLHQVWHEDEIITTLQQYPLLWADGRTRAFVINRDKSLGATTIEITDSSVKIHGRCPNHFNFFSQMATSLSVTEFELIVTSPSTDCDISGLIATLSTLTKARIVINEPISNLLNLEILSQLPHLKSFILTTDEFFSPKCPVNLPASISVDYLELRAGQLLVKGTNQKIVIINNIKSDHQMEIYTDRTRQDWIAFQDTSEPAMNKISITISDGEDKQVFHFPADRQKLFDRLLQTDKQITINNIFIYFARVPNIRQSPTTTEELLSASISDIQEIYDLLYPVKVCFLLNDKRDIQI